MPLWSIIEYAMSNIGDILGGSPCNIFEMDKVNLGEHNNLKSPQIIPKRLEKNLKIFSFFHES